MFSGVFVVHVFLCSPDFCYSLVCNKNISTSTNLFHSCQQWSENENCATWLNTEKKIRKKCEDKAYFYGDAFYMFTLYVILTLLSRNKIYLFISLSLNVIKYTHTEGRRRGRIKLMCMNKWIYEMKSFFIIVMWFFAALNAENKKKTEINVARIRDGKFIWCFKLCLVHKKVITWHSKHGNKYNIRTHKWTLTRKEIRHDQFYINSHKNFIITIMVCMDVYLIKLLWSASQNVIQKILAMWSIKEECFFKRHAI